MEILGLLTIFGATEEAEGIAALGIDPIAILAQAATFLLLFWVIKRYALDKIVDTLEKRRKTIDDGVRLGREMEAEKERLDQKVEDAMRQARIDADKIIAEAREEAGGVLKEAEASASKKVDAMLAEAHHRIEEDIDRARAGLEKDMRNLVAEATEVIIQEKLDAKKDASLLERAINKVKVNQ